MIDKIKNGPGWNGKEYGEERKKENISELENIEKEISEIKPVLSRLIKRKKILKSRIKIARKRTLGVRNDEARMRKINDQSKKFASLHYSKWDKNDEDMLIGYIGKMKLMDIAKRLGRTRRSIKAKIYKIKQENMLMQSSVSCESLTTGTAI